MVAPAYNAYGWGYVHLQPFRGHLLCTTLDDRCDFLTPPGAFRYTQAGVHGFSDYRDGCLNFQALFRYSGAAATFLVSIDFERCAGLSTLWGSECYIGTRRGEVVCFIVLLFTTWLARPPAPIATMPSIADGVPTDRVLQILRENSGSLGDSRFDGAPWGIQRDEM